MKPYKIFHESLCMASNNISEKENSSTFKKYNFCALRHNMKFD